MTGFERRLAELEEALKAEQSKNVAFKFFVFKYLTEIEKHNDLNHVGFDNRAELATLFKDEGLDSIANELDALTKIYKRIK